VIKIAVEVSSSIGRPTGGPSEVRPIFRAPPALLSAGRGWRCERTTTARPRAPGRRNSRRVLAHLS